MAIDVDGINDLADGEPDKPVHEKEIRPDGWNDFSYDTRPRYKLTIGYDGKYFAGWQKQHPPGKEPLRTVCEVLERALMKIMKQKITLVGASRTDSGVHALGQVAHFNADTRIPIQRMCHAINSRLPEDLQIYDVREVPKTFHSIRDALRKQYRFRIFGNRQHRALFERGYVWQYFHELDVQKMQDAADRLVGTHDFEGFSGASHGRKSTIRTILNCEVHRVGKEVHVVVEGNGFLYNMVRIIVGTLAEVGRGRYGPDRIDRILETTDRKLAGVTAGGCGLCLEWIVHEGDGLESVE